MKKLLIPNQYFGIGDIIFCQTLVHKFMDAGYKVLWPVMPQFVDQLNRAYPDITFVDKATVNIDYDRKDEYEFEYNGMQAKVIPLRWADSLLNVPYSDCMKSKYMLYGLDWQIWREKAMWDISKQGESISTIWKHHIAKYNEYNDNPFTIVNRTFGSDGTLRASIPLQINEVEMIPSKSGLISLFDWGYWLSRATEIHTVSTSIIYLLEMLNLKAKEVHLYSRKRIHNGQWVDLDCFDNVRYILTRHKYVFHD